MSKHSDTPPDLYVSLKTSWDEDYEGFVLHKSQEWWLVRRLMDWTLDGYAFIRPRDIVSIKRGNAFFQRVCRKEGLLPQEPLPFSIDFRSTRAILKSIQKHCRFLIVNFDYEEDTALYLGRIERLQKESMEMRLVWTTGRWDKGTPARVGFKEISCIQFRSNYLSMFEKYVSVSEQEQRMR